MRRLITAAFAVCAAGCGPVEEAAAPRIDESRPETATVEQAIRRDEDGIIIMNGLPPAKLAENFLLNNHTYRSIFISRPLVSATFATTGALGTPLRADPNSLDVLEYVVRCALAPSDAPVVAMGVTMRGEAGLCRAWASGSIEGNTTCQRQVSACLLALSNAVGAHVPVSIRSATIAPSAEVRPYSMTSTGDLHPVFASCGVSTAGVHHNCGWQPVDDTAADAAGIARIFRCAAGATVRVGGGSSCTGTTLGSMTPGSDKVLRVCSGIGPCKGPTSSDPAPVGFLGQAQNDSCGTIKPEVVFTCPADGKYVVMQRDYYVPATPRTPGTMTVGHLNSLGAFSETQLFGVREGAFFGSLFTGPLGREVIWGPAQTPITVINGPIVFPGTYSCEDASFRDEVAYRTARLCTLSGGHCLSSPTGICQGDATHENVCDGIAGASTTGAFYACWSSSPPVKYDEGLTTFLRGQCDLVASGTACKQDN